MELKITKKSVNEYIQTADIDEKIKNAVIIDEALSKRVEKWIGKQVKGSQYNAVKVCKVTHLDYDNVDLDEIEDEFDRISLKRKMDDNKYNCPYHTICPLYLTGNVVPNTPCLLEVADVDHLTEGYYTEFDIDFNKDFTDIMMISQLVGLQLHYNRAERSLSSSPMVDKIVTFAKGGNKVETKISEYLTMMEKLENLMGKIRSKLLATREDKLKFKKVEEESVIKNAEKNIMDIIGQKSKQYVVDDSFIEELDLGD